MPRLLIAIAAVLAVVASPAHAGWSKSESVVPGHFADAEVFKLADGRYRMLYGTESGAAEDVAGIYSSVSRDGKTWEREGRVLAGRYSGPDVASLPGGGYRLYLNGATAEGAGVISLTSADGADWAPEPGLRLPQSAVSGDEMFGFTSTMRLADGTWLMAYEIDRPGRYARNVPRNLSEIRWATSPDGLSFTPRGKAVASSNKVLLGSARSPEFFGTQLYFHSLTGIFRVSWTGAGFTKRPKREISACRQPTHVFPWTPPPADPTLARIGGKTMLFHGDHRRGIFRSVRGTRASRCFKGIFVAP